MPWGKGFGTVRKLPSGKWQARYHQPITGMRITGPAPFATKIDARIWLTEQEADLLRGETTDIALARTPLSSWAHEWLDGLLVKTKVAYESSLRSHVMPVFANAPVNTITYRDCEHFVDSMLKAG